LFLDSIFDVLSTVCGAGGTAGVYNHSYPAPNLGNALKCAPACVCPNLKFRSATLFKIHTRA
jgi:hypothetical protein